MCVNVKDSFDVVMINTTVDTLKAQIMIDKSCMPGRIKIYRSPGMNKHVYISTL